MWSAAGGSRIFLGNRAMELLMNTSSQVRVPQSEHDEPPTGQRAECILSCVIRKISGGTDLGHRRDAYSPPLATVSAGIDVWRIS